MTLESKKNWKKHYHNKEQSLPPENPLSVCFYLKQLLYRHLFAVATSETRGKIALRELNISEMLMYLFSFFS